MKNKKMLNIICIFLIIQPIYDSVLYLLSDVLEITLPFISMVRPFLAMSLFIYLLIENKENIFRKKIYFLYLSIFCIYAMAHLLHVSDYFFEMSNGNLSNEFRYLANYGYYLLLMMNFDLLFRIVDQDDKKKLCRSLVYAAIVVVSLYFLSILTQTSARTYSINSIKEGWKGWSVSSHYIGHSLTFLTPITIHTIFEKKYLYNKYRYLIMTLIIVPGIYLVGTKTPLFAISIIIVTYFLFRLFYEIRDKKKISKDTLYFLVLIVFIVLTFSKTYGYDNFTNQLKIASSNSTETPDLVINNSYFSEDSIVEDQTHVENANPSSSFEDKFAYVIFNNLEISKSVFDNREIQKILNADLYNLNSTSDYLLGYGYNTLPNCIWVETDTYAIFYSYGMIGFLLIIVIPMVWIAYSGIYALVNIKNMNSRKFILGVSFALSFYIITEVGYTMQFAQTVIYLVCLLIICKHEFALKINNRNTRDYLFAINDLCIGGAEVGLVDVVNELVNENTVDVVLLRRQGDLLNKLDKRINVYEILDSRKPKIIRKIYQILYFMGGDFTKYVYYKTIENEYKTEVSYLEGYPAVFIANSTNSNSTKIASIRVGLKNHTLQAQKIPFWKYNLNKAYAKMDKIYTVSKETTREFIEIYPKLKHKTSTIYTYFNVEDMKIKSNEKTKYKFDGNFINFLAVGRFAEQKAYIRLVEAFEEVLKLNKNVMLHFIGNYETEYGNKVLDHIKSRGLEEHIVCHGVINNPYPYIKTCSCLISSSLYEGYPRVINEAIALNTVCIGTNVTGTVEALDNGNLGILVEDSKNGIVNGMLKVINNDNHINVIKEQLKKFDGNKKFFFENFKNISVKKKNMIIYMPKLSFGGMEKALVNLINYSKLCDDYEVTLFLMYKGEMNYLDYLPNEVKLIVAAPNKWDIVGKIRGCLYLLKMSVYHLFVKYDISISYSYQHPVLCFLSRLASYNNVIYIHNNLIQTYSKRELNKKIKLCNYKKFSKIICVSDDAKNAIIKILDRTKDIYSVNNVIDGDQILEKSTEKVSDYKFSKNKITFINICRHYEPHKKLTRIINATEKLNNEKYKFDVLFIGDGVDNELYRTSVKTKKLNNLHIIGKKSNPYKYLKNADVFLLSSAREGYPVVFIETMVLNKPIITTNISDSKKDIEDKFGIVCDNNDESIYYAMKEFLDNGYIIKKEFDYIKFNSDLTKKTKEIYKK